MNITTSGMSKITNFPIVTKISGHFSRIKNSPQAQFSRYWAQISRESWLERNMALVVRVFDVKRIHLEINFSILKIKE